MNFAPAENFFAFSDSSQTADLTPHGGYAARAVDDSTRILLTTENAEDAELVSAPLNGPVVQSGSASPLSAVSIACGIFAPNFRCHVWSFNRNSCALAGFSLLNS